MRSETKIQFYAHKENMSRVIHIFFGKHIDKHLYVTYNDT